MGHRHRPHMEDKIHKNHGTTTDTDTFRDGTAIINNISHQGRITTDTDSSAMCFLLVGLVLLRLD